MNGTGPTVQLVANNKTNSSKTILHIRYLINVIKGKFLHGPKAGFFLYNLTVVSSYYVCRPGSVIADILVKTFEDKDDSVEKTLKADMEQAKLGDIPVDRYKYSFEPARGKNYLLITTPFWNLSPISRNFHLFLLYFRKTLYGQPRVFLFKMLFLFNFFYFFTLTSYIQRILQGGAKI